MSWADGYCPSGRSTRDPVEQTDSVPSGPHSTQERPKSSNVTDMGFVQVSPGVYKYITIERCRLNIHIQTPHVFSQALMDHIA